MGRMGALPSTCVLTATQSSHSSLPAMDRRQAAAEVPIVQAWEEAWGV